MQVWSCTLLAAGWEKVLTVFGVIYGRDSLGLEPVARGPLDIHSVPYALLQGSSGAMVAKVIPRMTLTKLKVYVLTVYGGIL